MNSAVLFVIFNRPETTARVFEAIRSARPPRLYVAADGPRTSRSGEADRCRLVREIASRVDWPCELHTLFREANLGCKLGVSGAIDWFFQSETEGIILEDDVVPLASFFGLCDELLETYRDDPKVFAVSGCNLVSSVYRPNHSYFFSRYCHVWGWATWRRAWEHYDVTMKAYPAWRDAGGLESSSDTRGAAAAWQRIFDAVHRGAIDTWDYQWLFCCWSRNALCILPANNLTQNLGFDNAATHTTGPVPSYVSRSVPADIDFPLSHPDCISRDIAADRLIDLRVFGLSLPVRILHVLRRKLGL